MFDEPAFLEAIAANPDDDTTRLVYADWLEEAGRPERADFVRTQVQLAHLDEADPRYPGVLAWSRRTGVLTDPALRLDHERVRGGRVMFRRGFVAGLEARPAALLAVPPERIEPLPLEQLRLLRPDGEPDPEGRALAGRRDVLTKLRTLAFGYGWDTPGLEPLLTDCPYLAGLSALAVGRSFPNGGHTTLPSVVSRLALPSLDSLALHLGQFASRTYGATGSRGDPDDWDPFLPGGVPLRRLHLDGWSEGNNTWEWPGPGYDWLTGSRHWPTLEVADLRMGLEYLGTNRRVASAPAGGLYKRLAGGRLRRVTCGTFDAPEQLCATPDWGPVDTVRLHHRVYRDAIARVLAAPQAATVRRLVLNTASFGGPVDEAFERHARDQDPWPSLRHLSLKNCPEVLLRGAFCRHLTRLDVGAVGRRSPVELVAAGDFPELRHLTLGGLPAHADLGQALAPLFHARGLPNLCTLVVSHHRPLDAEALDGLANNPHLPYLSLVGAGERGNVRDWWVIGEDGPAPVSPDVIPLDEDWWEPDPLADWFW